MSDKRVVVIGAGGGAIGRAYKNRTGSNEDKKHVNVGTIGHVDHGGHGKQSLHLAFTSPSLSQAFGRVLTQAAQASYESKFNCGFLIKGRGKGGKHKLRKERGW
ncbi:hypothetical protein LMH73_016615 [Vibrio splendidus]|nr:hypothetical protein [Vibrio splendidus]MCC4882764.1 hypothetical protein [Vibrio splendidus]